jgi:hypothetical protein
MEKRLLRLGGVTVLVASAVLAIVDVVEAVYGDNWTNPANITAHAIAMPAGWLLVVGLPALVAAMASRAALLSAIGVALFTLSVLAYEVATGMFDSLVLPWLVAQHFAGVSAEGAFVGSQVPMGFVAFILAGFVGKIIGSILLGVAILRSGAFSRVAAILLIAGAAVSPTIDPLRLPEWLDAVTGIAMLGGLAIAGWQLAGFSYKRAVAASPTPAATSA